MIDNQTPHLDGYVNRRTGLRQDQMRCPECDRIAESESVDVGVGLIVRGDFICDCGWQAETDGIMNIETYDDYFVDL
jgi:hypothetical protein